MASEHSDLRSLVGRTHEGRLIPVLGSGVGVVAGLPSSREITQLLAEEIGIADEDRAIDLSTVSEMFVARTSKQALERRLAEIFSGPRRPTPIHQHLARLSGVQIFISTGYDDLLERALDAEGRQYETISFQESEELEAVYVSVKGERHVLRRNDPELSKLEPFTPLVIRLFGGGVSRSYEPRFVVTESELVHLAKSLPEIIPSHVLARIRTSSLLFLGLSATGMATQMTLSSLLRDRATSSPTSWAVLPLSDVASNEVFTRFGVTVIEGELSNVVDSLSQQVEFSRASAESRRRDRQATSNSDSTEEEPETQSDVDRARPISVADVVAAAAGIDADITTDGEGLLAAAVALLPQKRAENDVLSTSTLFLAAVEWGLGRAGVREPPKPLASLAHALVSSREGPYDELRTEFFQTNPPTIKLEIGGEEIPSFDLSSNFKQAYRDAAAEGSVTATALVRSLLRHAASPAYTGTWFRDRLEKLEVSPSLLEMTLLPGASTHAASDLWTVDDKLGYAEYARAIFHFLRDPRTHPPLTISIQAPWGGGKTSLMRMIQRELDPVGYARAQPSSLPASAPAKGASAETLLDELREMANGRASEIRMNLGEGGTFPTIWFNAWTYQSGNQFWAGLGEAIVRGLTMRLDPVQREKFLLRLHLARVDPHAIRRKVYAAAAQHFLNFLRSGLKWVLAIVVLLTAAIIAGIGLAYDLSQELLGWTVSGSALAGLGTALVGYARALFKAKAEPAQFSLSDFLDIPNYSGEQGFVHQVNDDLRRILDILPFVEGADGEPLRVPIVLFIDDLDRCSPVKVAEVFEAINLFIAGEFPNCYVVLGMDSEIVAAALEEAHKEVVARLPAYSRQTAVGWRYMDKFVQLPFVIPPIDPEAVKLYAVHLAARENLAANQAQVRAAALDRRSLEDSIAEIQHEVEEDEQVAQRLAEKHGLEGQVGEALAREIMERDQRLEFIDARAELLSQDSSEIEALLQQAHAEFSNNPRELKRLVNVYRFYMNLRLARESRGQSIPTIEQTRNWVMMMLAWPEFYRWIRRSHTEWEAEASDLEAAETGRLLKELEDLAIKPIEKLNGTNEKSEMVEPTLEDWTSGLESRSGLSKETPWLSDERLFRFFQRVANAGHEASLAAGAGKGFW